MFAEAFLGEEEGPTPTPAAGGEAFDDNIQWLVETRRPTTVMRFSGTLLHPSNNPDMQSMTVFAFAHFVWGHSNNAMIFADIQGTWTLHHLGHVPLTGCQARRRRLMVRIHSYFSM